MEGIYQERVLVQRSGLDSGLLLSQLSTAITHLVLAELPFVWSQPRTMARLYPGDASARGLAGLQDFPPPRRWIDARAAGSVLVRPHSGPRRRRRVDSVLRDGARHRAYTGVILPHHHAA